jgi:ketosteroid isomerase-like protein
MASVTLPVTGLKEVAQTFVEGIGRGKVDDTLVTESMTCWVSGNSVEFGVERLRTMLALLLRLFPAGFQMTVDSVILEGDRAAVLAHAHGVLDDGISYDNFYHYALRFEGARICEMREYMDSGLVSWLISPRLKILMAASATK